MEVDDGFIVGVYNYCDRWCERCPLTSRCRVFALTVEGEFERDHGPLTEPMEVRQEREMCKAADRWQKEFGVDLGEIQDEVDRKAAAGEDLELPEVRLDDLEIQMRGRDFSDTTLTWLLGERQFERPESKDAVEVIGHFSYFIGAKIYRALLGLADDEGADLQSDANGSAKAALLALDRTRRAWRQLVDSGELATSVAEPIVSEIDFLRCELERRLPRARSFVRPGFDEMEKVHALQAQDSSGI